jgi:hypothetical protein
VDGRTWVVKTHWPERYGYRRFEAHRVVLLVRNPFDAIDSYFNMAFTNTHDRSLREVRPTKELMMTYRIGHIRLGRLDDASRLDLRSSIWNLPASPHFSPPQTPA